MLLALIRLVAFWVDSGALCVQMCGGVFVGVCVGV